MNIQKIDFAKSKNSTHNLQTKYSTKNDINIHFNAKTIRTEDYSDWAVELMEKVISKPETEVTETISKNVKELITNVIQKIKITPEDLSNRLVKERIEGIENTRTKDLRTIYNDLKIGYKPEDIGFDSDIDQVKNEFSSDDNRLAVTRLKRFVEYSKNPPKETIEDSPVDTYSDDSTLILRSTLGDFIMGT